MSTAIAHGEYQQMVESVTGGSKSLNEVLVRALSDALTPWVIYWIAITSLIRAHQIRKRIAKLEASCAVCTNERVCFREIAPALTSLSRTYARWAKRLESRNFVYGPLVKRFRDISDKLENSAENFAIGSDTEIRSLARDVAKKFC